MKIRQNKNLRILKYGMKFKRRGTDRVLKDSKNEIHSHLSINERGQNGSRAGENFEIRAKRFKNLSQLSILESSFKVVNLNIESHGFPSKNVPLTTKHRVV